MCSVTASHAKHPVFDSSRLHNCQDWWTRIWDGAGNPGLYNLVELEMASCCIGPWSRVESDLGDPTGPDHMELWHCTRVGWYKAQDSINHALNWKGSQCKTTISMLTREVWREPVRLYPACHKWRHSSYKRWVFKCAHKFTYCTKSGRRKGKMVERNPA